jgi:hypothetical protein
MEDEVTPEQLIMTTERGGLVPLDVARRAVNMARHIASLADDPFAMVREGDEVQGSLGPDALLVIDASHCIVICTPERRITVGDVQLWRSRLFDARTAVGVRTDLADEERRIAQADRLRAEQHQGGA